MENKNIKIVGCTHLWKKEQILSEIESFSPDIIGVELCKTRFDLLVQPKLEKQEFKEGVGLIDKISKAILEKSKNEGINYAEDQITASRYALENKIPLALLDRDIMETKRLMELLPQNEMQGFLTELMNFESKTLGEQTKNLNEVEVLNQLRTKYPVAFEFLVTSRDLFIAFKILKLMKDHQQKRVICFLGKGHTEGIKNLLDLKGG